MSSLARRSLRTTAAAAGIAALGVGFAGHALAAPQVPALPGADALGTPAAPDLSALEGVMSGGLPAMPGEMSDLPQLFTFEAPNVDTAGPALPELGAPELPAAPDLAAAPELPAAPAAPELPAAPDTSALDGIVNIDTVDAPEADPQSLMGSNHVGTMPSRGTAKTVAEMAQKAMSGGSVTEDNSIG